MPKRTLIQTATQSGEPVFVNTDGTMEPQVPPEITTNRMAYAASLHLVLKHTADFHVSMLEVLGEKQKLDVNEMIDVIQKSPRFQNMLVDPLIHSMGLFEKEDLGKIIPEKVTEATVDDLTKKMEAVTVAEPPAATEPPAKKRIVVRRKATEK